MARGSGSRDRTPPVVTITSPTNLSTVMPGSTVQVTVNATDNRSVSQVQLRIFKIPFTSTDPTNINTVDVTAPYTFTWNVPNINYADYTIQAIAYDGSSNQAIHTITVRAFDGITTTTTTVAPPPPPPVLPTSKILVAPTAFAQGGEGSCASHAFALLLSIEKYYYTGATSYNYSTNIYSPEYLYNKMRYHQQICECVQGCEPGTFWDCGAGSGFMQNISTTLTYGCCYWNTLPYSSMFVGCQNDSSRALDYCLAGGVRNTIPGGSSCHPCICEGAPDAEAANNKPIQHYAIVWGGFADTYAMKRLLANNHPISFSMVLCDNIRYPPGGDPNYVCRTRGGNVGGPHGMTVIGYDDAKGAWLVQNSWGVNWGWEGKVWVGYDYAAQFFSSGWVVTFRPDKNLYNLI